MNDGEKSGRREHLVESYKGGSITLMSLSAPPVASNVGFVG